MEKTNIDHIMSLAERPIMNTNFIFLIFFGTLFCNNTIAQDSINVFFESSISGILNQDSIEAIYEPEGIPVIGKTKYWNGSGYWSTKRYEAIKNPFFKYEFQITEGGADLNFIQFISSANDTIKTNKHSFWLPPENYLVKFCFKNGARVEVSFEAKKCIRKFDPIIIPPSGKYEDDGAIIFQTADHHSKKGFYYFEWEKKWEDGTMSREKYNLPAGIYKIHVKQSGGFRNSCTGDIEIKVLWEGGTNEEFENDFDFSKVKFSKG